MDSNVIGGRHEEEQAGKISAIIAAALLISACSTNVRGPQEKIAVINWEQAVSAHPQYAKLEQGEKFCRICLISVKVRKSWPRRS